MRLLWQSNAPWVGTGYGSQTKLILRELLHRGHLPTCFAYYGLNGGRIEYDGYEVRSGSNFDEWGNDVVGSHIRKTRSDVLVTLMDIFILNKDIYAGLDVPWVSWTPIDAISIGAPTLERLKHVTYPVAMSHFGAQQMMDVGIEPTATIYHAVDTSVMKPLDKEECRRMLSIPKDMFVVGMVMANKGNRKQFPLQMLAFKQFMEKHPDLDAHLYIHTEPTNGMGGFDMRALTHKLGLNEGKVFATNQYDSSVIPLDYGDMAKLYNAFDVLMNCSLGEGFGVPIVEAQACGVPVITNSITTMPEITHNGYTVELQGPELGLHLGWQATPDVEDMLYRLECVERMLGKAEAEAGRAWVQMNCDVQIIADQWGILLDTIWKEIKDTRAERRMVIP